MHPPVSPLPQTHYIYTHRPLPPRRGWALRGSGGRVGRWNVRSGGFKMCLLRLSLGNRNSKRPFSLSKPLNGRGQEKRAPAPPLAHTHLFIPLGTAGSSLRVGGKGSILGWHSLPLRYLGRRFKVRGHRWKVVAGRDGDTGGQSQAGCPGRQRRWCLVGGCLASDFS